MKRMMMTEGPNMNVGRDAEVPQLLSSIELLLLQSSKLFIKINTICSKFKFVLNRAYVLII